MSEGQGSGVYAKGRNLGPVKPVGPKFASKHLFFLYYPQRIISLFQAQQKQSQAHRAQMKRTLINMRYGNEREAQELAFWV